MPVTVLSGPRQCGKTTLARIVYEEKGGYFFDLEDPDVAESFRRPKLVLSELQGLIVIDEAQLEPTLYPVLRILVDADRRNGSLRRFLLTGSASPDLVRGTSESLAGRVRHIPMGGFSLTEVGRESARNLWSRGGFPGSFLVEDEARSYRWRKDFIETFLLRDLPRMGVGVPGPELRRLWTMVAHLHGQLLNASELGKSLGISHTTVSRHLDILEQSYVLRRLPPWHANIGKRQRKSPKIYVRDTGLLHALLNITDIDALLMHPKVGASWEGFVIEQIAAIRPDLELWFWQTQAGAEIDLFLQCGDRRIGVECKLSDRPSTTRSMHIALQDLRLDHIYVVYPGDKALPLDEKISTISLPELCELLGH